MCVWLLNATCYVLHLITARLLALGAHAVESPICHVSFMAYIDVNPAEFWGRFATKGVGWFPSVRCEHLSPESHHAVLHHQQILYQGAFALFVCDSHSFSPLLSGEKSRNKMQSAKN